MAVIHNTTLVPSKLDLLTAWVAKQDWYLAEAGTPELTKAGGFRLDDPDGAVGIEFMIVLDGPGAGANAYLVPMTYRDSALPGADDALIGTTEHGVLGRRWVYDGTSDPVLRAQVAALIQGHAQAQAQSRSEVPDPTVLSRPLTAGPDGPLDLEFPRVLSPASDDAATAAGQVTATWTAADGRTVRGVLITARPAAN
jgi:hypothetical protein